MKEFVTLSISLTIVCLLVAMFWLFYSLPLWIVWNYVITPIFNSDTLSLFESFMMMMGLNIIYVVVTLWRAKRVSNDMEI